MLPSAVLHHHSQQVPPNQTLTVHPPHPLNTHMYRTDGAMHPVRLPESPPETDSGAGSAGSPSSGSENSPYSPEYQNYHNHLLQGTVIHPPVGNGHPGVPHPGGNGVILGVQGMVDLNIPQLGQHDLMAHPRPPQGEYPYPPPQPTPGALAPSQVSPPSVGGSACPPSPYVLPTSNGHPFSGSAALDSSLYNGDGTLGRKRLRSDNGQPLKRLEQSLDSPRTSVDDGGYDLDGYQQQNIRFSEYCKESWHALCDSHGRELRQLGFIVVADKGFNYSSFDNTFVNQKKNHFQISVHIEAHDPCKPDFVRTDNNSLKPISEFRLDFYGVKAEMPSSHVQIKQSQTDRKPVPYEPVKLDLPASRVTKVTVARLHFSETTMNNQRKNGRPNPDQKYLFLLVSLKAVTHDGEEYVAITYASEKVIVRASNPGQFDNGESEVPWQKGPQPNSIYHLGPVGVGTDRPLPHTSLTVGGDVSCNRVLHASDAKFKQNIEELDYQKALSRLSQIRIVQYQIRPEVAEQWGLTEEERNRVGVIAQELEKIIPDAVAEVEDCDGDDYLQVDDSRVFYESVATVKELCRLTGNLEYKIDEVEKISKKLVNRQAAGRLKRMDSQRSVGSSGISTCHLSCSRSSIGSGSPVPPRSATKKDALDPHVKYTAGRQRHHRHCHHYCSRIRSDRSLCSNKIIQTTIIVLVIVMAFCLIAMATLYILDWHKRNNNSNSHRLNVPEGGTKSPGNKSSTGGPEPGNMEVPKATTTPATFPFPDPHKGWPGGTPPPELQACQTLDCPHFCCPNVFSYKADGGSMESSDLAIRLLTQAPVVGADFKSKESRQSMVEFESYVGSDEKLKTPPEKRNDRRRRTRRKAEKDVPGEAGGGSELGAARILVLGHNVTLDARYCPLGWCDRKRGNFTMFIPVSMYMPLIPVEIQFQVESSRYVDLCESENGHLCPKAPSEGEKGVKQEDKAAVVKEKQTNVYELPVGMHMGGAYRFRVGYATTSCQDPGELAGQTFEEYKLVFYRVCSGS